MNRKPPADLNSGALLSASGAQALDGEASAHWGLNAYALVEAAGRACAGAFSRVYATEKREHSIVVFAGKGNNAADALVMLKALILDGYAQASACSIFAVQIPEPLSGGGTPLSGAMLAVRKLGVTVTVWETAAAAAALAKADVLIDGIAGTGLTGPLHGAALEMAELINAGGQDKPFVVSVDLPSGNFDGWQTGMPLVAAHATLAIEPHKLCLYNQAARPYAGTIIPVRGIFPLALVEKYREAELVAWEAAAARIPPVSKTAYKYERGLVEIMAGSSGAAGAARLAALGAQAAGAGLVRLIVAPSLYPMVAPGCSGIMVVPGGADAEEGRFTPDAALLGPGWGRGEDRRRLLESYLPLEQQGLPLVLDADAIVLAKDIVFNGNTLLTPHPGEFAAYTGLSKDEILCNPLPALRRCAAEKKVHILYKSHVLYVVSPDGRTGIIDGMNPALAAGGSGDVLAGFCASIAARWRSVAARVTQRSKSCDMYDCACAAASLLVRAAQSKNIAGAFFDPAELAAAAAVIAGAAWLPVRSHP
ncbi:MAG: bifunctional ADP-dependent NAD(P)H-hydrate dehydratase/NAD(P)H-hydrate epimerase [Treponema sp.]|nr:bifunctional ADP-dependent NAD(P)H-hydrate dehydratase/NAD(P)H-hydrate epimerase [Treponema sp.]